MTVVVVARNEADMLPGCLDRLGFAAEVVVVVDDRTTDRSAAIAGEAGARVVHHPFTTFSAIKNAGMDLAGGEWTLIVDADERVSAELVSEMAVAIENGDFAAFRVPIANYFLGQLMEHGGWADERPVRLFRRGRARYQGDIHERLVVDGAVGDLSAPLVHFSHRSIVDNLQKTAVYADVQARELMAQGGRPASGWTVARAAGRQLAWRLLRRSGWRDGSPGVIEAVYQALSHAAVEARRWELQQQPTLPERYSALEEITR